MNVQTRTAPLSAAPSVGHARSNPLWPLAVRALGDALAVYGTLLAVYWLRFRWEPALRLFPLAHAADGSMFLSDIPMFFTIWMLILFSNSQLYSEQPTPFEDELVQVMKAAALGSLATLAVSFLMRRFENSRLMILMLPPISTLAILSAKQAEKRLNGALARAVGLRPRILLLGQGKAHATLRRRFAQMPNAVCFERQAPTLVEAIELLRAEKATEVILTRLGWTRGEVLAMADACEQAGAELKLVPTLLEERMGEVHIDRSMALPMFRFYHLSLSGPDFLLKRCFDAAFCAVFFAAAALPLLALALIIKLDSPGPVLYRQRRVGYKGRTFDMLKFRTMVLGAEERLAELGHLNERKGPVFKLKDDPRVTRVGRWLRRFSLDEVPQFINVLRGEMSIVGPRPSLPREVELYDTVALKRLNVLPGITGLWQVSGRADLDFNEMVTLDLYYVEHWSLGLDLKVILRTPLVILTSKGAY